MAMWAPYAWSESETRFFSTERCKFSFPVAALHRTFDQSPGSMFLIPLMRSGYSVLCHMASGAGTLAHPSETYPTLRFLRCLLFKNETLSCSVHSGLPAGMRNFPLIDSRLDA